MSEAKHTPGPWRVEVTSDGWDGKTTHIVGGDGMSVLSGWGYDAWGLSWGASSAESTVEENAVNPDACLIAAAPDLLAFVKAQFASTVCICAFKASGYTDIPCTRCDAESLITKAEGR